jgi:tyrosyl-tRNA synthetase
VPDVRKPTEAELHKLTKRAVAEIVPESELIPALKAGKPLRIKMGFDPTKPVITLGWTVGLRKLRQFQDLGHTIVVIVGDWTARIGDPSGKSETRPMLTEEEVMVNSEAVLKQFFKILDPAKTEVRRQTEWFDKFSLTDVVRLAARYTVAQLMERDDFAKRFAGQEPIGVHELLYPLLQGYDSVAIESDVEFGGTDQKFNILVGRALQRDMGLAVGPAGQGQAVLLVPLIVGLDGVKKMSQSLDNYIAIDDTPNDMFGKVMSIPDNVIADYFEMLTDVPDDDVAAVRESVEKRTANPMEAKKRLGREIVTQFHNADAAREAEEHFTRTFSQRELPTDVIEHRISFKDIADKFQRTVFDVDGVHRVDSLSLAKVLAEVGLASSVSEARRLIKSGAVDIDGDVHTSEDFALIDGLTFRVGKHRFLRVVDAD